MAYIFGHSCAHVFDHYLLLVSIIHVNHTLYLVTFSFLSNNDSEDRSGGELYSHTSSLVNSLDTMWSSMR